MLTHSAVHRENGSTNKHRAISPLIEIFYCGKMSSGPAGIYVQKICGDAEHETLQSCWSAWKVFR